MIDLIETGWLYASASGPQTQFVDLTFEVPNLAVLATTAVSAFSAGVFEHEPGSVATYIREYGVFLGPADLDIVDVPPDPANNTYFVDKCAYVRFRLTVFQATAWAQACVFRYAAKKQPPGKVDWKSKIVVSEFGITDRSTGKKIGTHRIVKLRKGSILPIDELLVRSASEAAAHLGISRKDLKVAKEATARPRSRAVEAPHVF